jgi:aspartate aminotransferase
MKGLSCANPRGAFYAFPNVSAFLGEDRIKDSIKFSSLLLRQAGVAVVPGSAFGKEGYVRISFATSMTNLEKGLDRMDKALQKF